MKRLLFTLLLLAAGAVATGCADATLKELGDENGTIIDNTPGNFRFQTFELDNVHDVVEQPWLNPQGRAAIAHRSFVHHGQVVVTVSDGAGRPVYSTPVEYQLDNQTQAGVPGIWTVRIQLYGARGRVDVGISALAGEGDPDLIPPLPPTIVP